MLKIITLLFMVPALAETLPPPDCDINELTQRCYVSVCSNVQHNGLPSTSAELESALATMNYRMPDANARAADDFVNTLITLNRRSQSLVETRGFDGIAEDILSNLDTNLEALHVYFQSDLPLVQRPDGRVEVIFNDMAEGDASQLRRLGNFLQSYVSMYQGVTQARERLSQPGAAEFFRGFLNDAERYFAVSNPARAQQLRSRRSLLTAASTPTEIATVALSQLTQEDLRGIFRTKFIGMKNDLVSFMSARQESESRRVSKGLQPGPLRESIARSCQLATYMMGRLGNANPESAFQAAKAQAIRGLHQNFLSRISDDCRRRFEAAIQADPFEPVQFDREIYPDFPAHAQTLRPFIDQMNSTNYLLQSRVFNHAEQFVCSVESFMPKDQFDGNRISTSLFTIATGHPDILAHELGHWVSAMMSRPEMSSCREKFAGLQQCLTGFYSDNSGYRTEEDFADWFMNTTVPSTGIGCTLDSMVPLLWNFMVGDTSQTTADPYTPQAGDNHSNGLFREIHGKMVRGETLSLACRQLLNQYPQSRPVRCNL